MLCQYSSNGFKIKKPKQNTNLVKVLGFKIGLFGAHEHRFYESCLVSMQVRFDWCLNEQTDYEDALTCVEIENACRHGLLQLLLCKKGFKHLYRSWFIFTFILMELSISEEA